MKAWRMVRDAVIVAVIVAGCNAGVRGETVYRDVVATSHVAVTNTQANAVWCPVALMIQCDAEAVSGQVSITKEHAGVSYTMGAYQIEDEVWGLVWVADAEIPFEVGDVWHVYFEGDFTMKAAFVMKGVEK